MCSGELDTDWDFYNYILKLANFKDFNDLLTFSKAQSKFFDKSIYNFYDTNPQFNLYKGTATLFKDYDLEKSTFVFDLIFKSMFADYSQKNFNLVISYFYEILGRVFFLEKALEQCDIELQSEFFSLISNIDNEENYNKFVDFILNWRKDYGVKLGILIFLYMKYLIKILFLKNF